MIRLNMNDTQQQAYAFLVSQATHFEAVVYKKQYPEFQYPFLIPVDTTADPWAPSITFSSVDEAGKAEFFNHRATDMPLADISREMFQTSVHMAGIGYDYSIQEINQAQKFGIRLTGDKADAARRAFHQFIETSAIVGQTSKNWQGLINNSNVTRVDAIADGTGSSRLWSTKTADQIARDINDALTGVYQDSATIEMADTVLLPTTAWTQLGTTRVGATEMTAWTFVNQNNVYTMKTGQQLTIRGVPALDFAGTGAGPAPNTVGRMVVYRRSPDILKMHIPMMHQFLPPWQQSPMVFLVPGIFRLAGLEIRRPGAVRYVDGITPVAS